MKTLRDANGKLLLRWTRAQLAEICAEADCPISPGDEVAVYDDVASGDGKGGRPLHITRRYCKSCGQLLEDSLTTTETV